MTTMNKKEMDAYQILEVAPGASRREIERAYYLARLAFGSESLASYSLYSARERTAILERIERAYRTLTNQAVEGASPAALEKTAAGEGEREVAAGRSAGEPAPEEARGRVIGLCVAGVGGPRAAPQPPTAPPVQPIPSRPAIEPIDIPGPYDGPTLRKVREARGLELEAISAQTKISMRNLRLIESTDTGTLPAAVYLRGFLSAYARCLRLDPQEVVRSYLETARGGEGKPGHRAEKDG
jgi:hypothetical protein